MLENDKIDTLVKQILTDTAKKNRCSIHFMESDKNHIHLMIETVQNINLSQLVNKQAQIQNSLSPMERTTV